MTLLMYFNTQQGQILLRDILNPFVPGLVNVGTTSSLNLQMENISIVSSTGQTNNLRVYIANTNLEREQGLMNVSTLPQNEGMIFIFNDAPKIRTFWMKNTVIPLDMIFFNSNFQLVYIQNDATPCNTANCTIYSSQFNSLYVLETNAGWAASHDLQPGDVIKFNT